MEEILKEKLLIFISDNNPDLLIDLQQEKSVTKYIDEKINIVAPLMADMLADDHPTYIVEEMCMDSLTADLKPSRYLFISAVLEQEFEQYYLSLEQSGILTYEIVNMIRECKEVFEHFGFSMENQDDPSIRNAITGQIYGYLNQSPEDIQQ